MTDRRDADGGLRATVRDVLRSGVDRDLFTGATAVVGDAEGVRTSVALGRESDDGDAARVTSETRFDAASLTKPVVTTTVALALYERGVLDPDAPLASYVPAAADTPRGSVPIRHLLTHTSGLPPYKSFPFGWESKDALLESLYGSPLSPLAPPGEWFVYSDLNFVHLADALRHATGETLATLAAEFVFEPFGMDDAALGPLESGTPVAETRDERWRNRRLRGEIHDYIGAVMEGEGGNAGLFVTAEDLARFARAFLNDGRVDGTPVLAPSTVELARRNRIRTPDRPHGLGWRLAHDGQPARNWSSSSYGHTGFTGTSLWLDPERDRFACLLTNRVLTDASGDEVGAFRRRFHAAVGTQLEKR